MARSHLPQEVMHSRDSHNHKDEFHKKAEMEKEAKEPWIPVNSAATWYAVMAVGTCSALQRRDVAIEPSFSTSYNRAAKRTIVL